MTEETAAQRILREATEREAAAREQRRQARPEDYVYDKAQEAFWDVIDGTLHGAEAVDASIPVERWRVEVQEAEEPPPRQEGQRGRPRQGRPRRERLIKPSIDIMRVENDLFVESSTWWPGHERIIHDQLVTKDGVRPMRGRRAFNTYEPPPKARKGLQEPTMWIEHIKTLWPDPREHNFFFDYCAHMVQRPEEKCNVAIVLSGVQGIGKDAALVPVRAAVGDWNAKNIDPDQLFSAFQPWLQSLMLIVDEVRPSKDEFHASSMYNILKPFIAAPPNTLALNDKHAKLRHIVNVVRVFLTTNDWLAMYIPPEDRRMFIMHSALEQRWHEAANDNGYFDRYWGWVERDGLGQVAGWLAERDISSFNPKAQAVRTAGWATVAGSWAPPEDGLTEALDRLGSPNVVFSAELLTGAFDHKEELEGLVKSPRKITHRMLKEGYVLVPPPEGTKAWRFQNKDTGRDIQARLVFVKQKRFPAQKEAIEAIKDHGKDLAAKKVSLRAVEGSRG